MKENRMVKWVWFVFFCLFSIFFLQAQEQNGVNGEKVDVVYLTNGVVVRGHIVSSGDGEMVVRTLDGQTKRFALTEVESTSSELMQTKPEIKKNFYDPGFRSFVELGYGFNVNGTANVFEVNAIGGYRFSKRFFLGLGVGWNQPTAYIIHCDRWGTKEVASYKADFMPIFVDTHVYLGKIRPATKHIFYIGGRIGGSINSDQPEYSPLFFSLSVSYQYRLKSRHSLNFSLAYNRGQGVQKKYREYFSYKKQDIYGEYDVYYWAMDTENIQTISLRVGYGF